MLEYKVVHKDARGEIGVLFSPEDPEHEIGILRTNKGFARGGCIHKKSDETTIVLKGSIWFFMDDVARAVSYKEGEVIHIPKGTVHHFVSETESIIAEWGPTKSEKTNIADYRDEDTRKIVDEINKKMMEEK